MQGLSGDLHGKNNLLLLSNSLPVLSFPLPRALSLCSSPLLFLSILILLALAGLHLVSNRCWMSFLSHSLTLTWKMSFYHAGMFSNSFALFDHLAIWCVNCFLKNIQRNFYFLVYQVRGEIKEFFGDLEITNRTTTISNHLTAHSCPINVIRVYSKSGQWQHSRRQFRSQIQNRKDIFLLLFMTQP